MAFLKKYTKIVCTIGPASEKLSTVRQMIKLGMNVARLNFSHGTYAHHAYLIRTIRAAARFAGQPIAIVQDLQGPRIRVGTLPEKGLVLKVQERVLVVPESETHRTATIPMIPSQYADLADAAKPGQHILIADGLIDLRILKRSGRALECSVDVPGVVKSHKGINVPGASFKISAVTDKDKQDIVFGVEHGVDYIALSFVSSAKDIAIVRAVLRSATKRYPHASSIGIIAKIERPEAIHNFSEILASVDGIMIARGDLGIEMPAERIPLLQKDLIARCLHAHKPVIVATQMLESMIGSRRPTRAEVSDVANAVIDHTDAVMLSGESATGLYPLETVTIMAKTIHETERSKYDDYRCTHVSAERTPSGMMAHAVCDMLLSRTIRCVIMSGDDGGSLARAIASHRPEALLIVIHDDIRMRQRLNLVRGVIAFASPKDCVAYCVKTLQVKQRDRVLFCSSESLELVSVS